MMAMSQMILKITSYQLRKLIQTLQETGMTRLTKTHRSHIQEDQNGLEKGQIDMDITFCRKILNSDTFKILRFVLLKRGVVQ